MSMDGVQFRVEGKPAPFATGGEKAWRVALEGQGRRGAMNGTERGLRLRFTLQSLAPQGKPLDLDNLVEPVLSVLVNRMGWFGSRRPAICWWHATKEEGAPTGCGVQFSTSLEPDAMGFATHEAAYVGLLPTNGTAPEPARWAATHPYPFRAVPPRLGLRLDFGDESVNIGDIATGRVKSFIDGLWPWFGGAAGKPNDHLIDRLVVTKGLPGAPPGGVRVRLDKA